MQWPWRQHDILWAMEVLIPEGPEHRGRAKMALMRRGTGEIQRVENSGNIIGF